MEIQEIKNQLSLSQVLAYYSLITDTNNRLCCPWHKDKTPSLQIYPKTNTWTCFSSNCNAGSGDAIDFIMKYEKISKHEALVKASQMAGGETKPSNDIGRVAILTKYYQGSLHSMQRSKKGKEYAKSRNLDVDKLKIGFCGYEVGKSWSEKLQENAKEIGLFKIKNCIIFPTKNKADQIVSIYGRSVSSNPKVRHFYLSGGFKGLYPSYPKSETRRLVLTESIVDAATIIHYTDEVVLALYGTNGFTAEHERVIRDLEQLEEVVLFFDGDDAGKAAIEKYKIKLQELRKDIKISCVNTPQGEDANSLVVSHESEILKHLIEQREFIFSSDSYRNEKTNGQQEQSIGKLIMSNDELLVYQTESLLINILGGIKITGLDRLRVTLKIETNEYSHYLPIRHSLDLYHSKQVELLTQKISEQLEMGTSHSQKVISQMTGALEQYRQEKLELLKPKKVLKKSMDEAERVEAMKYLKDKKLLRNTLTDIAKTGLVGETNNALIAYLTYTSRKREKPLHIMCLGASGTGKTYLQEKISELIPEEEKIEITSLSDNAFYYFGREELKHKLILIEDLDGAENALYPLRELQSKRRIGKTVTVKDNKGNLKTINLKVEGPVCVSSCTTRERIYEDNANRCILLYIDDSQDQDKRIMEYQKSQSSGQIDRASERQVKQKLKNVQRLLRPINVVNPYANLIDLPQEIFKPRRTLLLLLSFIETISYYHQYQRVIKTNPATNERYIETEESDIEAAFSLLKEVLFSKSDELNKASRKFLELLKSRVKVGETFSSSKLRKELRMAPSTLKRYLVNLSRTGYVKINGGSKYRGFEYEVCDYEEYENLQKSIDEKLAQILNEIKEKSGSVAH